MKTCERLFQRSDAPWLWDLYKTSLKPYIDAQWGWDDQQQKQLFFDPLPFDQCKILMLEDRPIAAYIALKQPDHYYIKMILIVSEYRNQGIGGSLIKGICAKAANFKLPVRLSVIESNPAVALYKRLGFKETSYDDGSIYMAYPEAITIEAENKDTTGSF